MHQAKDLAIIGEGKTGRIARWLFAVLTGSMGAVLIWLGAELALLGGSIYYFLAGLATLATAVLLWRKDQRGSAIYALFLAATAGWSLWEAGFDAWALAPRLIGPAVWGFLLVVAFRNTPLRNRVMLAGASSGALLIVAVAGVASPGNPVMQASAGPPNVNMQADGGWRHFGRDAGGTRFSPQTQITPDNAGRLKPLWSYDTGVDLPITAAFEAAPLEVNGSLYLCAPDSRIISLDAVTGKLKWSHVPHADLSGVQFALCRGVAYYESPQPVPRGQCSRRIIAATLDARLIAVDAETGKPCSDFGNGGEISLLEGMGKVAKGYYYPTSAPQIIRNKIVVGGWVLDNQHTLEPPGVIRAFDARTGALTWAFDAGRPNEHGLPPAGSAYTAGTPNSWAPISADEAMGLVYVPTGNSTPDWFGGTRRPFDDAISSSVLAIDAETGALRWAFQTTHHDIWDYDVASQPTLFDLPVEEGAVPALVQPTKRGQLFVLDRRTGKPLLPVEERAVPASSVPGESASPTQPFSTGIPNLAGPDLTERMMWGLTPIDQALCRIAFRRARYEGTMTPLSLDKPTLVYPGYMGGSDWGGVSIDTDRGILIANSNRFANYGQLITREEADHKGIAPIAAGVEANSKAGSAMAGTPYAVAQGPFLSVLGMPCQQPPFGMLTAIDLKTRKVLWQRPFGTTEDSGPLGIPTHLPIPMGLPNTGGSVVTRSGVIFIAAAQDNYLRAFDIRNGREIWKGRLPAGGQATPMTFWSPRLGRQVVVISAGGHGPLATKQGSSVVAFALPPDAITR